MPLAHRRIHTVGLSPLSTPTSEKDSSEEPGQLKWPLPAQPPLSVCSGAPGLAEGKLLSPFWFCLALVLVGVLWEPPTLFFPTVGGTLVFIAQEGSVTGLCDRDGWFKSIFALCWV